LERGGPQTCFDIEAVSEVFSIHPVLIKSERNA
jgi:hypothetical protein